MTKVISPIRMKRMHFLIKDERTISYPQEGNEIGIPTTQYMKKLIPNELNTLTKKQSYSTFRINIVDRLTSNANRTILRQDKKI